MSADTNKGNPAYHAFPRSVGHKDVSTPGMTLRDYFAAKAMAALIIGPNMRDDHFDDETNEYISCRAYFIADAMLAARDE